MLCFKYYVIFYTIEPEFSWVEDEFTLPEGRSGQACFRTNGDSVIPYQVVVGIRGKGIKPASSNL